MQQAIPKEQDHQKQSELSVNASNQIAKLHRQKLEKFDALNKALESVPNSEARSETVVEAKDPAKILVVIKDFHYSEKVPAEYQKAALDTQKQILTTTTALIEKLGKLEMLKDGVHDRIANQFEQRFAHVSKHSETIATLEKQLGTKTSEESKELLERLQKNGAEQRIVNAVGFMMEYQQVREGVFEEAKHDAVINLALQGKVEILPTEDINFVNATLELAQENPEITIEDEKFKELSVKREAYIFERVTKSDAVVQVALLGAAHSLADEAVAWNQRKPNEQIRVIEITPKTYMQFFGDSE